MPIVPQKQLVMSMGRRDWQQSFLSKLLTFEPISFVLVSGNPLAVVETGVVITSCNLSADPLSWDSTVASLDAASVTSSPISHHQSSEPQLSGHSESQEGDA